MAKGKKKKSKTANRMWGGRFESRPHSVMEQINVSIDVDRRLWKQDIAGSRAHAEMLVARKIINAKDGKAILKGLKIIEREIETGRFVFSRDYEDIHMNIEARLKTLIGNAAGKLHTARSRNDQVATDLRLWVRDAIELLVSKIESLQETLKKLEKANAKTVMPGFTHMQAAQPVTLALHLEAYRHMLARDKDRLEDCRKRVNQSPLGAAALAGTPYPIDRKITAKKLSFTAPMTNTMDAVSARDFANEFLFACAQTGLHLSRFAEEIILWATPQFGFITLSDAWSTGSSIMPQKKNPDAAELVRAKTGRLTGNLVQLMTVMKALPLAYNKDLQEDKEPVFDSLDTLSLCLDAMNGMLKTAKFNVKAMRDSAEKGYITATALADWLVMHLGLPFREAHHTTGGIVKLAEKKSCRLDELTLTDLQSVDPRITKKVFDVLSVK